MDKLASFIDDVYEKSFIDHTRIVTRGIVINNQNEILFEKIKRDDIFGKTSHLELPGGGVNEGENLSLACIREIEEECGLKCQVDGEIGFIEDEYNLIHRHNIVYYFLLHTIGNCPTRKEEYEKDLIVGTSFINIDKAIEILENPNSDIATLVYRRDVLILKKVKKMLEK